MASSIATTQPAEGSGSTSVHPHQLEVQDFASYDLIIDARSPREYEEDHLPGAINLPVAENDEYAQVGTIHRTNTHEAYLVGVRYSLHNIARHIDTVIARYDRSARFLVYCFRGGKRSRLWADTLRTIGFKVDVLPGGWKSYRRWVRGALETLPRSFDYRVLTGPTGCGKTRMLVELRRQGEQVLDLEGIACHRGSLIGDLPGQPQPSQKQFDSHLLNAMRCFDTARPIWVEAESKKIGEVQLPDALYEAMHRSPAWNLVVPMVERVRLWREDYPHFVADAPSMVAKLAPLKPLIGTDELDRWYELAASGQTDALFQRVMEAHYDPCYARSTRRHYGPPAPLRELRVESLDAAGLKAAAETLIEASAE